ncbi:bark storage A [Olea europaea subsp. europaea]|uniref:Bark storage A n=1 Tax=Olea europaea subsp. europaea TaxID=158383 RepID=A0A8S0S074_OLEEU|nr:bark storage A [Olea europaea subsp. europaea]
MPIVVRILSLGWAIMMIMSIANVADGAIPNDLLEKISIINKDGPYLGIVVPNSFEMNPLLQSSSFVPHPMLSYLDFAGRRFRLGTLESRKVIIVMSGLSMLNAGLVTQLLLSIFEIEGVVHFGIAGNANPNLQIGDVTIPHYWAHSGLWNWQRFGDGPDDELAFESNGDYTRKIGYLNFSQYENGTKNGNYSGNLLNNVWYQPEEIFSVDGQPEIRQHAFWVPVDKLYFSLAEKLEDTILEKCVNSTTCLPRSPKVFRVERGVSANVLLDNAAYRNFLYSKFNATPVDMESAGVALVCLQQRTPFIAIRALSDLAGGGSSLSNEAAIFSSLAAQNSVTVLLKFITLLFSQPQVI